MKLLVEIDGNRIVRQIELTKSRYTLGRDAECDIVFETGKVSRQHAELVLRGDAYSISDNSSRNHVYVNGEQVKERRLTSGDVINISRKVSLLFIAESDTGNAVNRMVDKLWDVVNKKDLLRLKEVTGRISALEKLDTILHVVLREAIRFVGAERGFIALTDASGQLSANAFVTQAMPFDDEQGFRQFVSSSAVERVISSREPVIIENTSDISAESVTRSVLELSLGSILCFPLLFNDVLVGVLYVDSPLALSLVADMDPFYFSILTDQAAIAIENAKLFERLEGKVQATEHRYQQLVDLSPDAVFLQVNKKIVFANPAALQLLKANSISQVVGLEVDKLFVGENAEEVNACLVGRADCSYYTYLQRTDQSTVEVELLSKAVVFNAEPSVLIIARDITRRRLIEREMLKAQKLDSISTLAGGLAHDFNNLLTAVMGNIAVAALKLKEGKVKEVGSILGKSELACFQAQDLTHQLLTFARGGEPIREAVSMRDLLEDTIPFVLRGTKVKCTLDLPKDQLVAEVDKGQLVQVLNNIAINAVQAMPVGGNFTVTAKSTKVAGDNPLSLSAGEYVHISLADEGAGIPKQFLTKIFDPYFTTKQQGSGLGLATAYSIMKRHDGSVSAESSADGTTFHLYLPASDEIIPEKKEVAVSYSFEGGRVLVMDDEPSVIEVATAMLTVMGFQVDPAADGEEALKRYRKAKEEGEPYLAVIMDLTIPGGMGGAETIKELLKYDPKARAIVSSGYSNDAVMANYKSHGFVGVMEKPYNLSRLTVVLQRALSEEKKEPALGAGDLINNA